MKPYISIEGDIEELNDLDLYMDLMYQANLKFYRAYPKAPRVIEVCRFKHEADPNKERFITARKMLRLGKIAKLLGFTEEDSEYPEFDCEDFACAEAAWLTANGREAKPYKYKSPYANKLHAVVRYTDTGELYDPSLLVGMKEH